MAGVRATLSRTGYTGERGYELVPTWDAAPGLWDALLEAGWLGAMIPEEYGGSGLGITAEFKNKSKKAVLHLADGHLARDLVGLKSYTTGNGIQAHYQRSPQGDLARIAYARISPVAELAQVPFGATPKAPSLGTLALLDHRYLWDTRGNLLHTQSTVVAAHGLEHNLLRHSSYAYDHQARLVASTTLTASTQTTSSRYAYDSAGRRVLSQQAMGQRGKVRALAQRLTVSLPDATLHGYAPRIADAAVRKLHALGAEGYGSLAEFGRGCGSDLGILFDVVVIHCSVRVVVLLLG